MSTARGQRSWITLLGIILIYPGIHGFALDPRRSIDQYVHDVWQIKEGLPMNWVRPMVQTRDGYIWIGTQQGLARFDGVRFTVFNRNNSEGLASNWIRALAEGKDGALWIGTMGGGLTQFQYGKFKTYTTKNGLLSNNVKCLYPDSQGNVWIGTDAGLNSVQAGRIQVHIKEKSVVDAIVEDKTGDLWIGTDERLIQLKKENSEDYKYIPTDLKGKITSLCFDTDDSLWIGTNGSGLSRLKDGVFFTYTTTEGLSSNIVFSVFQDRNENIWIGSSRGLDRFLNEKFESFNSTEDLPDDSLVWSMLEDREGSLWFGTYSGGLHRLKDGALITYTTAHGLSNNNVLCVLEDDEGTLWIGTDNGLNQLEQGRFRSYSALDGLSSNSITALHKSRDGTLWIGTYGGGLNQFKNGRFHKFTVQEGLASNLIKCIYEDREGRLWIGTYDRGVSRLDGNKFTNLMLKNSTNVEAIYQHSDGSLWIGTFDGISRFKSGLWENFTTENGLPTNMIDSIMGDGTSLWIGTTGGGLVRFQEEKFQTITARDGLFDDDINNILIDEKGTFWIGSSIGIFYVNGKELEDFFSGKVKAVHSRFFGVADGMKSRECNGGTEPTAWKTKDGQLWFSTIKGLVKVDPNNIRLNRQPPPVIIEQASINDKSVAVDRNASAAPGPGKLEFHYTALSFMTPEKVLFKYKLDGLDQEWVDANTRRTAYYTNISPGHYTFRVKACNNDGIWNEAGASFAFHLRPHFYQTYWFYGLCFLAALSMAIGAHRIRVRQLKARETDLIRVVDEKTRDLREANEKITRLQESAPQALENLSSWSKSAAEDIARAIGATEIAIWTLDENRIKPVTRTGSKAPSLEALKAALPFTNIVADSGETIVPLMGLSGEMYGALVISGVNITWGEVQRRLVTAFAHQLGGTLETQNMAKRLAQAEERKAITQQEMRKQGIPTLQVCPECGSCYDDAVESCEKDGAKLQAPRTLPYRIADRYRLSRMVDEGGMGAVFEAYDEKLSRSVAIKIIKAELLNDPSMRMRLEREAHMVARIRHPGVVSIYDFGELSDGSAFIVMEFLQGLNLADTLKYQGPGTPEQVATVLSQVGDALTAAHSQGVIHRDLKPANLFIIPSGNTFQVKVVDFGLAKSPGEQTTVTVSGMLVGSPAYMSPEQIRQQPLDARSDLFSLASLSYELITGIMAFNADHISDVLTKVLLEEPAPLSSRLMGAPPELDIAFFQAFQKIPEKRPKTVAVWTEQVVILLNKMTPIVPGWRIESILETSMGQRTAGQTSRHYDRVVRRAVESVINASEDERSSVSTQLWKDLEEVFYAALECEPDQRNGFLDRACARNPVLRKKVEALLAADQEIKEEEFPVSNKRAVID